ncbi:hypothetical protein ACJ2A9_14105 [Anaerobacillus sp. MEB173]|uniref:hypothetical protein n=1 Tax=Anaerobacillus sp. MEB173 TaxID=3383345 RepID=UPI003F8E12A4
MTDSKLYASMILSIATSSQNKNDVLKAIDNNFVFMGTLRLHVENVFQLYQHTVDTLISELISLLELFINDQYPYLAGITIKPSKGKHCHSS